MRITKKPEDLIINCDFENVYYPSDDTYMILDYFQDKIDNDNFDGIPLSHVENILDMGTGTGIIALFFQSIKSQKLNFKPKIYASDILVEAIICAKRNEKANSFEGQINFICSDLFQKFPSDLRHTFDIIVFNPPYLPSSDLIKNGENKKKIDYSWDGGETGYDVFVHFLDDVKDFLSIRSNKACVYFISSSQTDLKKLSKIIEEKDFSNEILKTKHVFFEDINLNRLKLTKP